jgi:predicted porin
MKKSLLALAVLGAFAGAASAQSTVTLYGRVDLSVAKNMGSDAKGIQNGSGSRLGLRGVEDLGGGLQAFFNIEHRFDADTGSSQNFNVCRTGQTPASACVSNRFWGARSLVGLQGGFGKVSIGREYTTSFLGSQLIADPWGWDTVVAANTSLLTGHGVARVRNDSSLTYNFAASGFTFGIQTAERSDTINAFTKRPLNFALGYAGGPFSVGMSMEKTGQDDTKLTTFHGAYDLGSFKLGAFIGRSDVGGVKPKSWMLTATAPMGQGEFRAMYGSAKVEDVKLVTAWGLGYHYSLSKRTTIYADLTSNKELPLSKNGWDFGVKHNF